MMIDAILHKEIQSFLDLARNMCTQEQYIKQRHCKKQKRIKTNGALCTETRGFGRCKATVSLMAGMATHREAGSDGVMCRRRGDGVLYHMDTAQV